MVWWAVLLAGSWWVGLLLVNGLESCESFYFIFLSYRLYNTNSYNTICTVQIVYKLCSTNLYTVWFLYELIQTNSYNCLWVLYKFIQFYTNCIVQINTKCDFYFFLSLCKWAASAQRKPWGQSPSCKRAARAARAKSKRISCPDQATPGCPDH